MTTEINPGDGRVLLFGHRGEPFLAPENTLASFALSWAVPTMAIELDVHLTADKQVIVCHDDDTFRTSGGRARVSVRHSTLEQIQAVDVGFLRGQSAGRQRCPSLAEVYASLPTGGICFTELKSGIDVVRPFAEVVRQAAMRPAQLVVISFDVPALERSRQCLPEFKHFYLNCFSFDPKTQAWIDKPGLEEWIETAQRIGCDGLGLGAQPPLDGAACAKVRAAGLELHLWATGNPEVANTSIDCPAVARQYVEWGAQSLTVNRARWMREQLQGTLPTE